MSKLLSVLAIVTASSMLIATPSIADEYDASAMQSSSNEGRWFHWPDLQQQSASHGSWSIPFDFSSGEPSPIGEFIDCTGQGIEAVYQSRGTFDFFAGVCDDLEGPPCENKLIELAESCQGLSDMETSYRIGAEFMRLDFYICYDEDLDATCSPFEVVASGELTAHFQAVVVDALVQPPARFVGVRKILHSKPFRFNGRWVRIPRAGTQINTLLDSPAPVPNGCDAVQNPCGYVASGIGIRR